MECGKPCLGFDYDNLGRVKQGVAMYDFEQDDVMREAEEACDSINLGRFSKEALPDKCMQILKEHLYNPEPDYVSVEGPPVAFVTRLLEFRTPHYGIDDGVVVGERKVDVLKVLTCTRFSTIHLRVGDERWMPCLDGETTEECMTDASEECMTDATTEEDCESDWLAVGVNHYDVV